MRATESVLAVISDIYDTRERFVITVAYLTVFLPLYTILAYEYLDCAVWETRRQILITMLAGLPIIYYCVALGPAAL